MRNIDVKSMLIGILLSALVVIAAGASGDSRQEQFQLHNMTNFGDANTPAPKVMDGNTAVNMAGVLKIDSETGRVWALSLRNNRAESWVEIK